LSEGFWITHNSDLGKHFCPDTHLFRFMSDLQVVLPGSKVLEIGHAANRGSDASECVRRGAKHIDLLDLTEVELLDDALKDYSTQITHTVNMCRLPVQGPYDLIYSRDTICYFSDEVLSNLLFDLSDCVTETGMVILQFIEGFYQNKSPSENTLKIDWNVVEPSIVMHEENKLRILNENELIPLIEKSKFEIIGKKFVRSTYGLFEEIVRCDKYLCLRKKI